MSVKRVHVFVSGDVQGVGFRWYCREAAIGRGVAGWVKNLPDGRVEAVFEGDPEAVEEMIDWCRVGPRWARVDDAEVTEEEPTNESSFAITR